VLIALGADHAGFRFKQRLLEQLQAEGHQVLDFGPASEESCDYPDAAIPAALSVSRGEADRAILVCTNGIGMAMAANRVPGVRAALVYSARTAERTRQHHDSNALCLGAGEFDEKDLLEFVRIWLTTAFEGGRHARRIGKFAALECAPDAAPRRRG
jgi:ribose 5-phosphate isomerase B